jgi:hypothetical protein
MVYFLSLRGMCRWSGSGEPELLDALGTTWLDDLAPAQLESCSAEQDPHNGEVVIAAPGKSQTENSKEYSFDPRTGSFFPDNHTHPGLFAKGRGANGKPILYYTQGNFIIQRSTGTNDLVPSGTVTGTVTSTTSTTLTDSTAAFYTTGTGLREAYVHVFDTNTHALKGSRRITSNTATQLTWSSTGAGGGDLTLATGDTYFVGPVLWYWKTPVIVVPAHGKSELFAHIGVEPDAATDRKLYVTETVDGTDKAVKRLTANRRMELVPLVQASKTYQLKVESRETDSLLSIRDVTIDREVREGPQ